VKTRLRPKHRRALLAALPPLAADLGDGRLVALAAEALRERAADLSLGEFALEEAQANTRVAAALLRGFEAAVGEPFPCEPTEISAALDRLRGRLAASDEVRRRAQQAGELERAVAEALGVAPPSVEKDPIAYLVRAVRTCRTNGSMHAGARAATCAFRAGSTTTASTSPKREPRWSRSTAPIRRACSSTRRRLPSS
jgi:pyruvate/2-oxoglutarate dehydrogenase complex dihydrolipoamide acyltransferase (E2) component